MKAIIIFIFTLTLVACTNYPIDEDGLLITTRTECYVSNFDILDTDFNTVKIGNAYIDTLSQIAIAYVRFGTQLNNLWPQVSLCEDAKLAPKITNRMDFSNSKLNIEFIDGDWDGGIATNQLSKRIIDSPQIFPQAPIKFTVISGNRLIKKEYTFLIVERPLQ